MLGHRLTQFRAYVAFAVIFAALTCSQSMAANVTIAPPKPGKPPMILVEGVLNPEDADTFEAITSSLSAVVIVSLNSDGGSLIAGLRIGELIRARQFYTVVPKGMRCASACALAWLGGAQRFMFVDGKIGFHAASVSGRETGVGNALIGAYLTRIGLSYEAVIYITKAAPSEMTWLNSSDAARKGITISLLDPYIEQKEFDIVTRFGKVIVTKTLLTNSECCTGHITYRDQAITMSATDEVYATLEGLYQVKEGDLIIISSPSGVRGMPPNYYIVLVDQRHLLNLSSPDFSTSDWTFKVSRKGDRVFFDLGYEERHRKTALYENGALKVNLPATGPGATLPKKGVR
jgi:hypothetical protein